MMNKSCNVLNRKRKNKNRDHMLIEKFLGLYDPDCDIDYPVEGKILPIALILYHFFRNLLVLWYRNRAS